MEHQEYLRTISEVAITLTGFMGIVAALKIDASEWTGKTILQFNALLRASISASLLSFVPYLLYQFLGNEDLAWKIAAATFSVVMALNLYQFVRGTKGGYFSRLQQVLFFIGFGVLLAVILSVFGVIAASSMFLLGVTWQICVGLNNFALLLTSDIRTPEKLAEVNKKVV